MEYKGTGIGIVDYVDSRPAKMVTMKTIVKMAVATASTNGFPAGTMTPVGPKLAPTRVRSLVVIDTFHRLRQVAIPGDESKLMTEDATVVVPVT